MRTRTKVRQAGREAGSPNLSFICSHTKLLFISHIPLKSEYSFENKAGRMCMCIQSCTYGYNGGRTVDTLLQ